MTEDRKIRELVDQDTTDHHPEEQPFARIHQVAVVQGTKAEVQLQGTAWREHRHTAEAFGLGTESHHPVQDTVALEDAPHQQELEAVVPGILTAVRSHPEFEQASGMPTAAEAAGLAAEHLGRQAMELWAGTRQQREQQVQALASVPGHRTESGHTQLAWHRSLAVVTVAVVADAAAAAATEPGIVRFVAGSALGQHRTGTVGVDNPESGRR